MVVSAVEANIVAELAEIGVALDWVVIVVETFERCRVVDIADRFDSELPSYLNTVVGVERRSAVENYLDDLAKDFRHNFVGRRRASHNFVCFPTKKKVPKTVYL